MRLTVRSSAGRALRIYAPVLVALVVIAGSCVADPPSEASKVVVEPTVDAPEPATPVLVPTPTPEASAASLSAESQSSDSPAPESSAQAPESGQVATPVQTLEPVQVVGSTHHVDCADGDDAASGESADEAWRSVARIPRLGAGATLVVHARSDCTYVAPLLIRGVRGQDYRSAPVRVFTDQPGMAAVLEPRVGEVSWQNVVEIIDARVEVSDIAVHVACDVTGETRGFAFGVGTEGSVLQNVEVIGATFGVEVTEATGAIEIYASRFVEPGIHAMQLSGQGNIVEGNAFLGYRDTGSCGRGAAAVKLWAADGATIQQNTIRDFEIGLFLQKGSSDNRIEGNDLYGVRSGLFIDYFEDPDPGRYPSGNLILRNRVNAWSRASEGDTSSSFLDLQLAGDPPSGSPPNIVGSNSALISQPSSDRDQGIAIWCHQDCPTRTGLFIFANNLIDAGASITAGVGELNAELVGVIDGGGNVIVGADRQDPYALPGQHVEAPFFGDDLSWPCLMLDGLPTPWEFFAYTADASQVSHPGVNPCT